MSDITFRAQIEEAAERAYPDIDETGPFDGTGLAREAFIEGAVWFAGQSQVMREES